MTMVGHSAATWSRSGLGLCRRLRSIRVSIEASSTCPSVIRPWVRSSRHARCAVASGSASPEQPSRGLEDFLLQSAGDDLVRGIDHHLCQPISRIGDSRVGSRQRRHDRTEVGAQVRDRAHHVATGCHRPQLVACVEDGGRARSRRQRFGAPRGRAQGLDLVVVRAEARARQEGERHEGEARLRHVDPDDTTPDVRDVRHRRREAQRQPESPIDSGEDVHRQVAPEWVRAQEPIGENVVRACHHHVEVAGFE